MARIEGSTLPLVAGMLGFGALGVGLLLFAFGVEFDNVDFVRISAGFGGVVLLAIVIGLWIDFGPKRKKDG